MSQKTKKKFTAHVEAKDTRVMGEVLQELSNVWKTKAFIQDAHANVKASEQMYIDEKDAMNQAMAKKRDELDIDMVKRSTKVQAFRLSGMTEAGLNANNRHTHNHLLN